MFSPRRNFFLRKHAKMPIAPVHRTRVPTSAFLLRIFPTAIYHTGASHILRPGNTIHFNFNLFPLDSHNQMILFLSSSFRTPCTHLVQTSYERVRTSTWDAAEESLTHEKKLAACACPKWRASPSPKMDPPRPALHNIFFSKGGPKSFLEETCANMVIPPFCRTRLSFFCLDTSIYQICCDGEKVVA